MSFGAVGQRWTPEELRDHLALLPRPPWATSITFHHTAIPSLAQRKQGLTPQHILNLRHFYSNINKWSAGPHLFVDDHLIHGMTPLTVRGVHAVSFNRTSLAIEVLGHYDHESPLEGRGLAAWRKAAQAGALLLQWLGLTPSPTTILFHRDDPRTRKSCPGRLVKKEWVIDLVRQYL